MGRSVAVPSNAAVTAFIDNRLDDGEDWDWFIEDVLGVVSERFPSIGEDSGWLGREERIVGSNGHAQLVICEYCGCVSVSLVPIQENDGYFQHEQTLHDAWCRQVERAFLEHIAKRFPGRALRPLATASNGCTLYRRI